MAGADIVLGEQYVAGPHHEGLAVAGGEFKRSGQRNHVLQLWANVPIVRGMRRGLLEVNGDHIGAISFVYRAFKRMRRMIGSRVKFERSYPSSHRTARTRCHGDSARGGCSCNDRPSPYLIAGR